MLRNVLLCHVVSFFDIFYVMLTCAVPCHIMSSYVVVLFYSTFVYVAYDMLISCYIILCLCFMLLFSLSLLCSSKCFIIFCLYCVYLKC